MNNKLRSLLPGWNLEPQADGTIIVRKDGVMGYVAGAGPSIASNVLHELANDLLVALSASAEPSAQPAPPTTGLPERKSAVDVFSQYGLGEVRGWNAACDAWEPHAVRLQAELAEAAQRGFIRGINAEAAARREREAAQPQGEHHDHVAEVEREFENDCGHVHLLQDLPDGTKLYAEPPAPVALHIPDECPHLIVFDDADRQQLIFAGAGARESALKAWEKISGSWNAHLFVRVERNSRDDIYPSARPAPVADEDWHMNPCKQGHRDVGAAGGVASCYQCDEKITAATTQEAFKLWNAAHPKP